jgi:hypothetical protein
MSRRGAVLALAIGLGVWGKAGEQREQAAGMRLRRPS